MSLVHIRYWGRGYACGLEPRTTFHREGVLYKLHIPTCIACIANAPEVLRRFKIDAIGVAKPTLEPIFEEVL